MLWKMQVCATIGPGSASTSDACVTPIPELCFLGQIATSIGYSGTLISKARQIDTVRNPARRRWKVNLDTGPPLEVLIRVDIYRDRGVRVTSKKNKKNGGRRELQEWKRVL